MVMLQVSFEKLLEAIDQLPEEQKQIIRRRLHIIDASGVVNQTGTRTAGLGEGTPLPDEGLKAYLEKCYTTARRYWQSVGDEVHLALTDAELAEQFWLFDGEGIPRLKEDRGKIEAPETSLIRLLKLAEESPIEFDELLSNADPDSIIENEFGHYLWKRMQDENGIGEKTH